MVRRSILVTGFEPFGGQEHNSSQLLLEALRRCRRQWLQGSAILECLPTSYRGAKETLTSLLERHQPGFALHLGQAADAQYLRFESVAWNLDRSDAFDNDDECRQGVPIVAGAPPQWTTQVDPQRLRREAERLGQALELSDDCGGFVCNHVYFHSCHHFCRDPRNGQCAFVHVPRLQPDDNQLAACVQIIANWLKTVQTQLP